MRGRQKSMATPFFSGLSYNGSHKDRVSQIMVRRYDCDRTHARRSSLLPQISESL
jgi:hypothetical protein